MPVPSTNHHSYSPRVYWCWALIILLVFALFRLPGLGVPLVSDELVMVSLWAQMPYLKIFSNYQYPNNHIFLSLVISFLLKTFGLKEWLLRMPLLICGLVSIYLSYNLTRKITSNSGTALFTAFMMTICEKHIYFSTNARGYLVIMVLALLVINSLLDHLEGLAFKAQNLPDGSSRVLAFWGWLVIWIVGTWTVPTFFLFEISVAIFLLGLLFLGNRFSQIKRAYLEIFLISCVVGGLVFYLQYYVLIDSAMLAAATSRAAKVSLSLFFPELLAEWVKPFELAGILFFLLALIGVGRLFQLSRSKALLLACICLGPVFMGIAGFLLGKFQGIPHPRTFFYLQPFFLILSAIGGREVGLSLLTFLKRDSFFNNKIRLAISGGLAGVLLLISLINFYQNTYPQRLSREPLDKVHEFVEKLNPNDLILVSHSMYVEFYLYGSNEMQKRIKKILHDGKLENIYYLDHQKNKVSPESNNKEKRFLNFPVLTRNAGKERPTIPEKALEAVWQFGPYAIYRFKKDWLHPLQGWEKVGLTQLSSENESYRWEKVQGPSGVRPLLRFENSFTVAMESKKPLPFNSSALTLNLMEVSGNENFFSVAFVGGQMEAGGIILEPSWLANAWMLDHPYGSQIFNLPWNPAVFISQGAGSLSVIDLTFSRNPEQGAFRNFLSYRIDKPGVVKK